MTKNLSKQPTACILLAAGQPNPSINPSGLAKDHLMTVVNSKPAFEWVYNEIVNEVDQLIIVTSFSSDELNNHLKKEGFQTNKIHHLIIQENDNLLVSLEQGLKYLKPENNSIIILLGDSIVRCKRHIVSDEIFVAKVEEAFDQWCMAKVVEGIVVDFFEKGESQARKDTFAVAGRYHLTDLNLLKSTLEESLKQNNSELSEVLSRYMRKRPLRASLIENADWIDFGHVEGFTKAKRQLVQSRAFNSMSIHPIYPIVTKRSTNFSKLKHEKFWYENVPLEIRSLTPRIYGYRESESWHEIDMEFYGYENLASKLVYSNMSNAFWGQTLRRIFQVIEVLKGHSYEDPLSLDSKSIYNFLREKTQMRVEEIFSSTNCVLQELLSNKSVVINGKVIQTWPSIENRIYVLLHRVFQTTHFSIMHGDLCFNNILFDAASGIIKLIDPRGNFGGSNPSIYGDLRYDVAKLRHSFCGGYDHIVEGRFHLSRNTRDEFAFSLQDLDVMANQELFARVLKEYGFLDFEIRLIEGLLFLSMIPLHSDNELRQTAFYLKSLLIFDEILEDEESLDENDRNDI